MKKEIKRLCDIILNNQSNIGREAEGLALFISHDPDILNFNESLLCRCGHEESEHSPLTNNCLICGCSTFSKVNEVTHEPR